MAKTAPDPTEVRLCRELQRLVEAIASGGEDEDGVEEEEEIDKAREVLSAIRDMRTAGRRSSSAGEVILGTIRVPEEFKCPLSKEMMKDPVVVASGHTYDRPFIQKWLKAGNMTCPKTQQVLLHKFLTPNLVIRDLIAQWCKSSGVCEPPPAAKSPVADREHFVNLLHKMSGSSINSQKEAAKELRLLTKNLPPFRAFFGESLDFLLQLVNPLCQRKPGESRSLHPELQEDVITTILNLSIYDNNKKLVAENPKVMGVLLDALQTGTIETRRNTAAALFTLSALDSNKILIGKSGALKYLINLLEEGHPMAMKDVASAVFNLCILHDNRAVAVKNGAIRVTLKQILNRVYVDEMVAILALLASHPEVTEQMESLGGVPCLLDIIRESPCDRNKENCIAILHRVCLTDRILWRELREEANTRATISRLAQSGTPRAKRKAISILERLNKAVNITHTA